MNLKECIEASKLEVEDNGPFIERLQAVLQLIKKIEEVPIEENCPEYEKSWITLRLREDEEVACNKRDIINNKTLGDFFVVPTVI